MLKLITEAIMDSSSSHHLIELRSVGWWEVLCWWLGFRQRVLVEGRSMMPVLQPGEEVLVANKIYNVGDLVVVQHPFKKTLLIKQVAELRGDGCWVVGINEHESTDSRSLGLFARDSVLGVVTCRLRERQ